MGFPVVNCLLSGVNSGSNIVTSLISSPRAMIDSIVREDNFKR